MPFKKRLALKILRKILVDSSLNLLLERGVLYKPIVYRLYIK